MATTLTISLPEEMNSFVEERTRAGAYASADEFIRDLLLADQQKAERERLETLLVEGLESGEPIRADDRYWDELRQRVERNAAAQKTPGTGA